MSPNSIELRWSPFGGWQAFHNGEMIRGRKWKEGDMVRRFPDPDKAISWAIKELAYAMKAGK